MPTVTERWASGVNQRTEYPCKGCMEKPPHSESQTMKLGDRTWTTTNSRRGTFGQNQLNSSEGIKSLLSLKIHVLMGLGNLTPACPLRGVWNQNKQTTPASALSAFSTPPTLNSFTSIIPPPSPSPSPDTIFRKTLAPCGTSSICCRAVYVSKGHDPYN